MKIAKLFCVIALLTLAGCATRSDLDVVQRDNEELKSRLFQLEKDLNGVKTEARASVEGTLKDFQTERETERKGLADMQASMDGMKVDTQVLAGKIDDLSIAAKKPAEDVALLRDDLERRLTGIEQRLGKVETGLDDAVKKITALEAARAQEAQTPEALYQKGLDTYRAGDFPTARDTFNKFLELYPKNDLAANAHYWVGETYYSEKKYEQAILEFQNVIKNYPGKEKVPAAMFKQAVSFAEIGDNKSARYVLRKLIEDYPASEEAKRAKETLKELK